MAILNRMGRQSTPIFNVVSGIQIFTLQSCRGAVRCLVNGSERIKRKLFRHVESLLCALGALAGYACQANLRAQAIAKGVDPNAPFNIVKTSDGKRYFFGDPLNKALAEDKLSVWSLSAGAAQHVGATSLPDINEIFKHTASSLGSEAFGVPRYPEGHSAGDLPINYVKGLWPALLPIVKKFAPEPVLWPLLFAVALQNAIEMSKGAIAPELALSLVMEAAIPMSKVDLDLV